MQNTQRFNNLPECFIHAIRAQDNYSATHTFNGPFLGLPGSAGTRKVKPIWILLKQETVSGSSISWAICKSAPRWRQITIPAPHHSVSYWQHNFAGLDTSSTWRTIPKQVFFGRLLSGKSPHCGPVRQYRDTVKTNMKRCGLRSKSLSTAPFDRAQWCTTCQSATTSFEESRVAELDRKQAVRKQQVINTPGTVWPCDRCSRTCFSRIGLFTHRHTHRWRNPSPPRVIHVLLAAKRSRDQWTDRPSLWAAPPSVSVLIKIPSFSKPASAPTPMPMILSPRPSLPVHTR